VEKAICANPELADLDREINAMNTRVVHRPAATIRAQARALQREQDAFIARRNAGFGRPDYDLRKAMKEADAESAGGRRRLLAVNRRPRRWPGSARFEPRGGLRDKASEAVPRSTPAFREPIMRSFVSPICRQRDICHCILTSFGAPPRRPPSRRSSARPLTAAEPAKLIESCTALIDNPATPEADRLDATITRAAALHSGQTAKALAEIDAVIAKDPNRARAFRARGEILRQTGKTEAAFEALNEAIRLEPDNANGYANRGNAFNNAGKYDRAIEDYNEALRLKPDFAQAFSDRGAAWYFKGEYQKAIADYDEAIRLEPNNARDLHQPRRGLPQDRPHRPRAARMIRRRSGSIRRSRNSSTIAASTSPPMAITKARSPTTTKRSRSAPSRNS
jgi:tetratricopeptide (TPR) repeat protein